MAEHHPPDELLLEYATGAADPAVALMVASHATLCPLCRERIAEHEALAGTLLRQPPATETPSPRDLVARIMAEAAETPPDLETDPRPATGDGVMPFPLQQVVGPHADLPWKTLREGIDLVHFTIPGSNLITRVLRLGEGFPVPRHGHRGLEMDLVLTGGIRDHTRKRDHHRGDVQVADTDLEHELEILPGESCTVFTVTEGRVVPKGLRSRAVYAFLGF